MPRPRTHWLWIEKVRHLAENEPKLSSIAIRDRLEEDARRLGRDDWPSDKTIRRIRSEYEALPPEERRPYQVFRWPESMESGALPWEASRAALDLLRNPLNLLRLRRKLHSKPIDPNSWVVDRPTIRLVKWFWRVSQAAADANFDTRHCIALELYLWETIGRPRSRWVEDIEWFLALTPWRSEQDNEHYQALAKGRGVDPHLGKYLRVPWAPDEGAAEEIIEIILGHHASRLDERDRADLREYLTRPDEGSPI